jgi:carbon starvation protein
LLDKAFGIHLLYGTISGTLLVEGFVVTTLDTAFRLNHHLFEELWQVIVKNVPKIIKSYLFNTLLSVPLVYLLAYNNAVLVIWPIFCSANQLLGHRWH